MDIITAKLGAKMAQEELQANGQIGYFKNANAVLIPESSYAFASGAAMLPVSVAFTEGDRVTTTLDGVEYSATAKSVTMPDGTNGAAAGNHSMLGGEDTGEPFFAFCGMMAGALVVALFVLADAGTDSSQHTVSISAEVEEVHAIDPKYIPTTVVDLTDVLESWSDDSGENNISALGEDRTAAFIKGIKEKNLEITYSTSVVNGDNVTRGNTTLVPMTYSIGNVLNGDKVYETYQARVYWSDKLHSFVLTRHNGSYDFNIIVAS